MLISYFIQVHEKKNLFLLNEFLNNNYIIGNVNTGSLLPKLNLVGQIEQKCKDLKYLIKIALIKLCTQKYFKCTFKKIHMKNNKCKICFYGN